MRRCVCGKKLKNSAKFCVYCGKKFSDVKKENRVKPVLFIVIAFVGILSIVITILIQNQPKEETELPLFRSELVDTVKEINQPQKEQRPQETKREGYRAGEKPFFEGDYEYDERTVDFRLVCTNPCPVPRSVLDQEFTAISYGVSTLRGLTKSDLNEDLLPFEVHASKDSVCPRVQGALAYATIFTDSNGYSRGLLCFFFDELSYDRSKFPYSTSVHEITHLFEFGKIKFNRVIYEGLSEVMESFFLKGNDKNSFCWEGNNWYGQIVNNPHDPHGTGRQLFFSLCKQYEFDYDDLPELFRQFEIKGGNVDEREFVNIVNGIVGFDTSNVFREAGVI